MIRLRFERTSRKLSQHQLAMLARLGQGTISKIEIGRLQPTQKELEKLSRVFGVPPADLMKDVTVLGSR